MAESLPLRLIQALHQATPAALLHGVYRNIAGAEADERLWTGLGEPVEPATVAVGDLSATAELLCRADGWRRGTFYTPDWLVDHLLDLVAPAPPLLDPACGAGAFLLGALRGGLPAEQVYGTDRDPLAVLSARLALALHGLPAELCARQVTVGDGLLEQSDGWRTMIGNPPWGVRLDPDTRAALIARLGPELGPAKGEACSAAVFLVASVARLAAAGRLAFVLPESWLSTRRAEPLRRWLLREVTLRRLEVFRKGLFAAAPDMVPTVAVVGREPPGTAHVEVRTHGLNRPKPPPIEWATRSRVRRESWLAEPLAVFAVGADAALAALWERLQPLPRLAEAADIHDGIYKTRLLPLLDGGPIPVLTRAAEVGRGVIRPGGAGIPPEALAGRPDAEQARMRRPKVLLHAMRKPALADRLVAAADARGKYVVSNNLVMVLPRGDWSVAALTVLLNSRLVNRWFADRFIQVNIEAFALGAIPVPRQSLELRSEADVDRAYGVTAAERAAIARRWQE